MKRIVIFFFVLLSIGMWAQEGNKTRFETLVSQLDILAVQNKGLNKSVTFNVREIRLPDFIRGICSLHKVDIGVDQQLNDIKLTNNFSQASVKNVLLYLCKEFNLTLEFVGTIISIKKYEDPNKKYAYRNLKITYSKKDSLISFELRKDSLFDVFKAISEASGHNLVFAPGMENIQLTSYINQLPLDNALDKLAFTNDLEIVKTKDGNFVFQRKLEEPQNNTSISSRGNVRKQRPIRSYRQSNFYYQVKDTLAKLIEVDFSNVKIEQVINQIGRDLKISSFTTKPLQNIGTASVRSESIHFDKLLKNILGNTKFSYKKDGNLYIFGEKDQAEVHQSIIVPLRHRSIEIFSNNSGGFGNYGTNASYNTNYNTYSSPSQNLNGAVNQNSFNQRNNQFQNSNNRISNSSINNRGSNESLESLIPKEYLEGIEVKIDKEQNSFIVTGSYVKTENFKKFIESIDQHVSIVLIEVMIIESNKSLTLDTGIELGVKDSPTELSGKLYPDTGTGGLNFGAEQINRIIGGFDAFGVKNLGNVIPNFYANLKYLETNGNITVKSTPKLATLNSHDAYLSIGETTYYAVTQRNVIGTQNPQTSEITNYHPINAQLGIRLTPLVAADGSITLNINVVQSNFNSNRISDEAPPGVNSREFSSAVRVYNNDVIILGGLEEKIDNDSSSGVPLLSRIPILKYLFSSKKKEDSRKKLSIMIKPTIL